jgi:hypothetical protein
VQRYKIKAMILTLFDDYKSVLNDIKQQYTNAEAAVNQILNYKGIHKILSHSLMGMQN